MATSCFSEMPSMLRQRISVDFAELGSFRKGERERLKSVAVREAPSQAVPRDGCLPADVGR